MIDRRVSTVALLALGLGGCFSIAPPPTLIEDPALASDVTLRKIDLAVSLAPIRASRALRPEEGAPAAADDAPLSYRPPVTAKELGSLTGRLKDALDLAFTRRAEVLGPEAEDGAGAREAMFREAERRGAQVIMTAELLEDRLDYRGFSAVGWFFDFSLLTGAPPFHWWVPDERFELSRRLEVAFYDVRDQARPLYRTEITAAVERSLNEFQHEIVIFNPIRGLWDSGAGRYSENNLKAVYEGLGAHADRELQIELLKTVTNGLGPLLSSTDIRERLRRGDPARARLYGVFVGQDTGQVKRASADARAFSQLLQRRFDLLPAHARLIDGPVSRRELFTAIKSLRTKAVDRLLFFFAGQGGQDGAGQHLVLSGGDRVGLEELAGAFSGVAAENLAFIIDASFGDAARAGLPGARTAPGAGPLQGGAAGYLGPLIDLDRGWQVICAAGPDEVTGEFRDQGLLTGLLLERLSAAEDRVELGACAEACAERFARRARALLGGPHALFRAPSGASRRPFVLELAPRTRDTQNR